MLNLKVARECDQALQEVHDLPPSTFGLESYVERVETLVTSEGKNAAPRYVGVYGMGGVGITLLLQTLCQSPEVRGHFQGAEFIWLTVGQTPDIMALYRTLSKKLHLDPDLYTNPEDYKRYLHTQFIQKRVFLVLDDVWKDKAFDSLDLAKGDGSVTLLSTRNQSLLERASPQISQEHISPLSKEDSWSLFCEHAFRAASNVTCKLEALARSIAEECKGLPLALKVIGRAMYGKTSPEVQWEPFLKKLGESRMQETSIEEELYECLKLGYDLLSEDDSRLKDCFLYFAAFREDEVFTFQDILWGWRGEGLVPANDADDPRADVFSLLSKLLSRSFIESIFLKCEINDMLQQFKLHDVMRDLAFYILEKDCGIPPARQLYIYRAGQNLEKVPNECTAIPEALKLSLHSNKLERLPENFYAPKLLCLILGKNPIIQLPASFLRSFQKLKVLDLSGGKFWDLPKEVGDLKHLVSLDLSFCQNLWYLPDAVRKLQLLKQLNIEFTRLKYLPSGVVGLPSLQILCTGGNFNLIWAEHTASGMPSALFLCDVCSLSSPVLFPFCLPLFLCLVFVVWSVASQ
jgi:disease resistance protein RPS2